MKTINDYQPRKKSDTPIAFFHYMKDGKIKFQGYVIKLNEDRTGECQLFEWISGTPSQIITVTRAFFDDCVFYDSDYEMNSYYDNIK